MIPHYAPFLNGHAPDGAPYAEGVFGIIRRCVYIDGGADVPALELVRGRQRR